MAANQRDRWASRQRCWGLVRDQGRSPQWILGHSCFYWGALFYCAPKRGSALRFGVSAGNVEHYIWSESCFNTALYLYDKKESFSSSISPLYLSPSQGQAKVFTLLEGLDSIPDDVEVYVVLEGSTLVHVTRALSDIMLCFIVPGMSTSMCLFLCNGYVILMVPVCESVEYQWIMIKKREQAGADIKAQIMSLANYQSSLL